MNAAVACLPTALTPADAVEAQIRSVFERQRATALRLRTSTADERLARITRLRDTVLANREAIHAAAHQDFRKPATEVDLTEILPVVAEANDARRHLKRWMKPKGVLPTKLMIGTKGYLKYEPKGRCLIISPWNYPVNLTFGPLVSAIAAGNTAILKPSEMTPHLTAVMVRIVRELFSEEEVAIFEGDADVSTTLLSLPLDEADCFVAPTMLTGIPADAKIMNEEIFGPLLPIIPYTDLDPVLDEINRADKPLALYVWSRTPANIDRVLDNTSSAGACVNHSVVQFLHGNLPFGGANNSGIGSSHGEHGFKAFSHERAVVRTHFMLSRMFFLPHSPATKRIVDVLLKVV